MINKTDDLIKELDDAMVNAVVHVPYDAYVQLKKASIKMVAGLVDRDSEIALLECKINRLKETE